MNNLKYVKGKPTRLREVGKDEKWLQDLIDQDATILGLGNLVVIKRESIQPTGGRVDLILQDEEDVRYEVEIQLGATDETHIIRTIEYWDVERRRYPNYEHRAVIVAEEITNRFFNVISLFNRTMPIIAIQLNAIVLGDQLLLSAVKVLDVTEPGTEETGDTEPVDRADWIERSGMATMELMDSIIALLPTGTTPSVKYNRGHVAVSTTGVGFAWFHPRKDHMHFHIRFEGDEVRDGFIGKLEEAGIQCGPRRRNEIRCILPKKAFEAHKELIRELLLSAEQGSHR
jgi:hypothetical protein